MLHMINFHSEERYYPVSYLDELDTIVAPNFED